MKYIIKLKYTFVATILSLGMVALSQQPTGIIEIKISQMKFNPLSATVKLGQTLKWVNDDLVPHTVTSTHGDFDSKEISPGQNWSFKVKKLGRFEYLCAFHPTMRASFLVK